VFDWRRAGSWCGLAGSSIFLMAWAIAIATTPGYDFGGQWVSDLGVGAGASFFNAGAIMAGMLSIPFAVTLAIVLRPSRLGIAGSMSLALAGVFLMGVGIFTENAGETHWIVSISFFSLMVISMTLLSYPLFHSATIGPWTGQFTATIVLIGIGFVSLYGMGPLAETVAVLLIAIWSLAIAWKLRWYLCVVFPQGAFGGHSGR
jgi:hypothetical membrane protein